MKIQRVLLLAGAFMVLATAVQADWFPGEDFKMHHPQLPDPNGWDVAFNETTLADDFLCTESGEITDVHFWVSWRNDFAEWESIQNIHLSIHSDAPAGSQAPWSQPDQLLWEADFDPAQFVFRPDPAFSGPQGWYNPFLGIVEPPPNHFDTWQINITDIQNPFVQQQGEIYWLDIRIDKFPSAGEIGWKTSMDHWNDDGVFGPSEAGAPLGPEPIPLHWQELRDPISGESLDLAFVVVPEPSVILLLVIGGAGLYVRKRLLPY